MHFPPSPLQQIYFKNHHFYLKRDDLYGPITAIEKTLSPHPITGNKWRKLYPFLQKNYGKGVITYGGAFSNHLHAVASAGSIFGFPTVGVLRGTAPDLHNPTLRHALAQGMRLVPVPKKEYDAKEGATIEAVRAEYAGFIDLPEGGSTDDAIENCRGIAEEILEQLPLGEVGPIFIACPAGTGCTAAGVLRGLAGRGGLVVFPVVKTEETAQKINALLENTNTAERTNWHYIDDYVFGGFARYDPILMDFIQQFEQATGILLDPVYTGKMLFGLIDLMEKGFFPKNSRVIAVHTGGLQGWDGFRERFQW